MEDYILDVLLNNTISELVLFGEINQDGIQEKEIFKDVKCYIDYQPKTKYMEDKFITLNAVVYIKGKITENNLTDGLITIDNNQYKILRAREYKDIFSSNVVYTRIEVI